MEALTGSYYQKALNASAIVAITDVKGKIEFVNDQFCKMSGYSREELIGQDHRILNSGEHDRQFMKSLWATIGKGENWSGEIKNRKKNGEFYWVDTTIVPFIGSNGKPEKYMAIRFDITGKKKIEHKNLKYLDEIKSFTQAVSHDLKTPLRGLYSLTQFLEDEFDDVSPEVLDILNKIRSRVNTANQITDLLREYSELVYQESIQVHEFDLNKLLDQIVQANFKSTQNQIQLSVPAQKVNTDPWVLGNVLIKVLENAFQHNKHLNEGLLVRVEFMCNAQNCNLIIENNGLPISNDAKSDIFKMYKGYGDHAGLGTGLAFAQKYASLIGGSLKLDEGFSEGVRFVLEFPQKSL